MNIAKLQYISKSGSVTNCADLIDILDILNVECGRIKDCMAMCICKGTHPRYVSVTLLYGNRFMDILGGVRLLSLFYDSKRVTKICQSNTNDEMFECSKWGSSGVRM